jgi:hypothetical protein
VRAGLDGSSSFLDHRIDFEQVLTKDGNWNFVARRQLDYWTEFSP